MRYKRKDAYMKILKNVKSLQIVGDIGAICDPITGICEVPGTDIDQEAALTPQTERQTTDESHDKETTTKQ